MLSPAQERLIFKFIPATFTGVTVKKIQPWQLSNAETYPLIMVSFITPGAKVVTPVLLRDYQDPDTKVWTSWWGQYNVCTVSVKLIHTDLAVLQSMVYDFLIAAHSLGPGAFAFTDGILFRGTDPPKFLQPFSEPGKALKVHRASIDLFFRYEFAYTTTTQPMKLFRITVTPFRDAVEGSPIYMVLHAPGSYSMDVSII